MWRFDAGDMFGFLAGIILGLAFFALVAYLVYLFVFRRLQMNHELRLELIKQGRDLPSEAERYGSLKAGIILSAIGLGLFLGLLMEARARGDMPGGETVIGFVPLLIGLGLIGFHISVRKNGREKGRTGTSYSSESLDS